MTATLQFVAHPGAGRGAFARAWPAMGAALAAAGLDNEVLLTTRAFEAPTWPAARRRTGRG